MDIHDFANVKKIVSSVFPGKEIIRMQNGNTILWEKPKGEPFYIEDISGSNNVLTISSVKVNNNDAPSITVEKSTDGINWTTMGTTSTTAITATIPANGKLYLRAVTNAWYQYVYEFEEQWTGVTFEGYNKISISNNCNIGGNIMSLLYGDDYGRTVVPRSYQDGGGYEGTSYNYFTFRNLFSNNTTIIDASKLILPATTLNSYSYANMFSGCTSLTTAPELPATTPNSYGYANMFKGCTALTTAPDLPATTLDYACYQYMFDGCTSLTTAPALPATTLASYCYAYMFRGCTSLTTAPALPATTLAQYCYSYMFYGCTSLTTAPSILPATTLASYCYVNMFDGCTSLTTAPELPAATLTSYCYNCMFQGCNRLNYIKCLATNISATRPLYRWVSSVAATGTFIKDANMTSWPSGIDGIPSGWTVQDA